MDDYGIFRQASMTHGGTGVAGGQTVLVVIRERVVDTNLCISLWRHHTSRNKKDKVKKKKKSNKAKTTQTIPSYLTLRFASAKKQETKKEKRKGKYIVRRTTIENHPGVHHTTATRHPSVPPDRCATWCNNTRLCIVLDFQQQ